MKIFTTFVSFILFVVCSVGVFFFLLLALNGFSERDATPAIYLFIGWTILVAIILSVGSFFLSSFLPKKSFRPVSTALIAIILPVGIGIIFSFVGLFVAAIVASEIRQSRVKTPVIKQYE